MKYLLFVIITLMTFVTLSAQDGQLSEEIVGTLNNANQQRNNDQYKEALETYQHALDLLRKEEFNTDSMQAVVLTSVGFCYNKLVNIDKALESLKEAESIVLRTYDENCNVLTIIYDNWSYYLIKQGKYQEAEIYNKKALDICYRRMKNDIDMALVLMRAAEIADFNDKSQDAVSYHEHALSIFAQNYGIHHERYISELEYMTKYYKKNNQEDKVKETEEQVARLKDEAENGYVPNPADLSTAEKCQMHNDDAYYASLYFLKHPLKNDSVLLNGCCPYIMQYAINSPDIQVISGAPESEWMKDPNGHLLFIAYTAGFITYQLKNGPEEEASLESYTNAVVSVVNYYVRNQKVLGQIKSLDHYVALYNKDSKSFFKSVKKDYEEFQKQSKKNHTSKIKAEK